MAVHVQRADGGEVDRGAIEARLRSEGLAPSAWENGPGDRYGWHQHPYDKVLYCASGSITFHTPDGDVELSPGDRMELPAGTDHAADVGPDGVVCVEAHRASP
jgi:quercetin dioxygenase-like cupin family protein